MQLFRGLGLKQLRATAKPSSMASSIRRPEAKQPNRNHQSRGPEANPRLDGKANNRKNTSAVVLPEAQPTAGPKAKQPNRNHQSRGPEANPR